MNMSAEQFCIVAHDTNRHLCEGYGDPVFEYALDQIRRGRLGDWMSGLLWIDENTASPAMKRAIESRRRLCHAVAIIASESRSQFREEELADAMVEHCGDELRDAMEGEE